MKKYKQLNLEERVTIKVLLQQGKSKCAIARYLGRSPSTIHREICRGITLDGTYFAESTKTGKESGFPYQFFDCHRIKRVQYSPGTFYHIR